LLVIVIGIERRKVRDGEAPSPAREGACASPAGDSLAASRTPRHASLQSVKSA